MCIPDSPYCANKAELSTDNIRVSKSPMCIADGTPLVIMVDLHCAFSETSDKPHGSFDIWQDEKKKLKQ